MDPEPTTEKLKLRQSEQEHAEREAVERADNQAEAEKHKRRADKARYLREKLSEQEQADRQGDDQDG